MKEPTVFYLAGFPATAERQRKAGILRYVPQPGARKVPCDRCAQPTWIGPTQSEQKRAHPEMEFLCLNCIAPIIKAAGGDVDVRNCGGESASIFLRGGQAFLPKPPKGN